MAKIVCTGPIGKVAEAILSKYADIVVLIGAGETPHAETLNGAIGFVVRGGGSASAELIERGKDLKVIGRSGTGCDTVDLAAATKRGIPVVYTPGHNARAVAEAAFALIAALTKRLSFWAARMRQGDWASRERYNPGDLEGRTLGIIGFGNSGRILAKFAKTFGMKLLAYDPYVTLRRARSLGMELVDFRTLCERSNVLSLHLPLTPETRGLINRDTLNRLQPGTILVNMARGGIIEDLDILLESLQSGRLAGVGLDVFEPEPPDTSHPIFQHPDCLTSPHSLALTEGTMNHIYRSMANGMAAVFQGKRPRFVANPEVFQTPSGCAGAPR